MSDEWIKRSDILGVVLCGGKSRRFGGPKPFFEFRGRRLVDRAVDRLAGFVDEVCIATGDDDASDWPDVRRVHDRFSGIGPMAGIHAAFLETDLEWLLVLAVDLPYLTHEAMAAILTGAEAGDLAAIAIGTNGRAQPLCGVYHRAMLPHIESTIARKEYGPTRLLAGLSNVRYVTLPDEQLRNINRREDLPED